MKEYEFLLCESWELKTASCFSHCPKYPTQWASLPCPLDTGRMPGISLWSRLPLMRSVPQPSFYIIKPTILNHTQKASPAVVLMGH